MGCIAQKDHLYLPVNCIWEKQPIQKQHSIFLGPLTEGFTWYIRLESPRNTKGPTGAPNPTLESLSQ